MHNVLIKSESEYGNAEEKIAAKVLCLSKSNIVLR